MKHVTHTKLTIIILLGVLAFQLSSSKVSAQFGNIPGGNPNPGPGQPGGPAQPAPEPEFDPFEGPNNQTFESLNPLSIGGGENIEDRQASAYKTQLSTPGGIVSRVLVFSFPLAGLILFAMLVWGGFEILIGGATKKMVDSGKQRITAALSGFLLLFSSYWIIQIIEIIFGLVIL